MTNPLPGGLPCQTCGKILRTIEGMAGHTVSYHGRPPTAEEYGHIAPVSPRIPTPTRPKKVDWSCPFCGKVIAGQGANRSSTTIHIVSAHPERVHVDGN